MLVYSKIKKIICVGIGGGGMFYLAKFFHYLGAKVTGYDISANEHVIKLKTMGIDVHKGNPTKPFSNDTDLYLYTNALPDELKEKLKRNNPEIHSYEVGELYEQLILDFEESKMDKKTVSAFKKSGVAPLYDLDYSKRKFIGITGTDGKTTTATMVYHILLDQGYKPALISTVSAKIGDKEIELGFHVTTPAPQDLHKLLKLVEKEKCTHVIIEATSHGLAMGRLAGIKFDIVMYTNITNEHLDYHGTWEKLVEAKSKLITRHLKDGGSAVLNYDDDSYEILSKLTSNYFSYSQESLEHERRAVWMSNLVSGSGISFTVNINHENTSFRNIKVELDLLGDYNISNALAAITTATLLDVEPQEAADALSSFKTVTGRMQVLQEKPYRVIVDFAHTPNALHKALLSTRKFTEGRVILVFGCAGQRDRYKRFEMGKIAAEFADVTIITAEDPRTEKLSDINDEIVKGWDSMGKLQKELYRFDNEEGLVEVRLDAIKKAISLAKPGDTVIITGKAHEKSMCFGTTEYPWNDIDETKKLLK